MYPLVTPFASWIALASIFRRKGIIYTQTLKKGAQDLSSSNLLKIPQFGSIPSLTNYYFDELIEELLKESKIGKFSNEDEKIRFFLLNSFSNDRLKMLELLNDPIKSEFIEYEDVDPKRDSFKDETISEKIRKSYEFPTGVSKEITTASSYERRFLEECENNEFILDAVEQPFIILYKNSNEYTLDFLIKTFIDKDYLIEIKSEVAITHQITLNKYLHLIKYALNHNLGYALITIDNSTGEFYSLEQIFNMDVDVELEKYILNILDSKGIFIKEDLNIYKRNNKVETFAIQTIILKNGLKQHTIDFTLTYN